MADLTFEQLETGRTHQVHGIYEAILGPDGEPETEWALCAIVDGHRVPLQTFTDGYVAHMVGRPDTAVDGSDTAKPGTATASPATASTATAAADESNAAALDAANSRIAELEQQLAQAQTATGTEQAPTPAAPQEPPVAQ